MLVGFEITFIDFNSPACPFQLIFGIGQNDSLAGDVGPEELRDAVGCLLFAAADVGQTDAVSKVAAAEGVEVNSGAEVSEDPFQGGPSDDIAVVVIVDVLGVGHISRGILVACGSGGVNPKGGPELLLL